MAEEEPRERADVHVRGVLIAVVAIAASVGVSLLVADGLLSRLGHVPPAIGGRPFARTAGPPLEVTPQEDLRKFRIEEREKLERYRLVDPQAGIVQIPIERAMTLLAEEHSEATTNGETQ